MEISTRIETVTEGQQSDNFDLKGELSFRKSFRVDVNNPILERASCTPQGC
jgi:hypothetical protein